MDVAQQKEQQEILAKIPNLIEYKDEVVNQLQDYLEQLEILWTHFFNDTPVKRQPVEDGQELKEGADLVERVELARYQANAEDIELKDLSSQGFLEAYDVHAKTVLLSHLQEYQLALVTLEKLENGRRNPDEYELLKEACAEVEEVATGFGYTYGPENGLLIDPRNMWMKSSDLSTTYVYLFDEEASGELTQEQRDAMYAVFGMYDGMLAMEKRMDAIPDEKQLWIAEDASLSMH